jgi:hypothetical protein
MESTQYEYTRKNFRYRSLEKITEPTDAYVLGHLACDGGWVERDKAFDIESTSIWFVEYVRDTYCPDNKILYRGVRNSDRVNSQNPVAKVRFPKDLTKTMSNKGILALKPQRRIAGIPKDYWAYYLLGILDSDGYISIRHRKDCRTPRVSFGVETSAKLFIKDLQYMLSTLGFSTNTHERGATSGLRIEHTLRAIEFFDYIYSDLPKVFNHTKYKRYLDYKNAYCR